MDPVNIRIINSVTASKYKGVFMGVFEGDNSDSFERLSIFFRGF